MRLSARGDYAVRAAAELAAAGGGWTKAADVARAQDIPPRFLENILVALRRTGIVESRRGADGGFRLARPAAQITVADVIRATEGPIANVRGQRPDAVRYRGTARPLQDVWIAARANLRAVLESVTLADVAAGSLPAEVLEVARRPRARESP
jgi:Rrf2 family protein